MKLLDKIKDNRYECIIDKDPYLLLRKEGAKSPVLDHVNSLKDLKELHLLAEKLEKKEEKAKEKHIEHEEHKEEKHLKHEERKARKHGLLHTTSVIAGLAILSLGIGSHLMNRHE